MILEKGTRVRIINDKTHHVDQSYVGRVGIIKSKHKSLDAYYFIIDELTKDYEYCFYTSSLQVIDDTDSIYKFCKSCDSLTSHPSKICCDCKKWNNKQNNK